MHVTDRVSKRLLAIRQHKAPTYDPRTCGWIHAGITQTCGWNRDSVIDTHMRVERRLACRRSMDMRVQHRHAGRIWTCRKKIFLLKKGLNVEKIKGRTPNFRKIIFSQKIFLTFFFFKKVIKGHQKSKIDIILKRKVFANAIER